MATTDEERDIIRQILDLTERNTTQQLDGVMANPVTNYTDPARFEREVAVLFRQFPLVIAHASDLASAGDFITHDETGVPMLVTRTGEGSVKAYLNVCRHRGARVEGEACGNSRRFTCPYHAWNYDLDGTLVGMPQPFGFESIDRSAHSLVELPAFERFGLIWVVPSRQDRDIDLAGWVAPLEEHLDGLDLGDHVIFRRWSLEKQMSWRFVVEAFQECYHFCSAHRDTACSNYLDNQSLFLHHGPHVRHAVPLPQAIELRDQPEEQWDFRGNFMTQNYVFPANFVQVMTDHVYVHTVLPTGPGTSIFQCMMLIPETPATEKAERYWQKNYDVIRTVFDEDFAIGEGIQKGLGTGANDHFVFGTYECGLHHGQRAIDDALAGRISL